MSAEIKKHPPGLTLLEVIAVIALIGILSFVLIAQGRTSNTDLPARTRVLKAHLRYAQSRAMNTDTIWGIQIDTDNATYRLFNSTDAGDRPLPGEDTGPIDLSTYGLSITSGDLIVTFDTWGRPCSDTAGGAPFDADQTITLADAGGKTGSITITRNTGFIP